MGNITVFLASASSQIINGAEDACGSSCNAALTATTVFSRVANALTFLIGAVAVIMVIIGGFRYVTSNGDAKQAAEGRQTILYTVVGVVLALCAYAIINFVAGSLG